MYEILIAISIIVFVTGLLLFTVDKELKYLDELGIKKAKLVTITKFNFLFIYQKRNERIITKFVYINTMLFYMTNLIALTLLVLHFILKIDLLYIISCSIFFINLIIIVEMGIKISLNNEQRKIKLEDHKRRKNKQ